MSGLQEFLTPFSHLIFANRDKVIVLLAALLAWFTIQLLITRWRNERLERDLSAAKSGGGSGPSGRRYATSTPVDESHAEGGALPPVKGGRTYARNLGTALQKAGMSGPQIYSPPTPAGWAPNTNPLQAGPPQPQPGMPSPYATPNAPWAAPTPSPPSPWGFQAAAGRPMPGAQPSQAPFYQPPPPPPQPMGPPQSPTPPPSVPGLYGPPPPFGQPAYPAPSSGPAAPAPSIAHPGMPTMPGGMPAGPAFGNPPGVEPPSGEPPAQDGGRRGKPKRRRFNFNVLENLEKMVQQKVEPVPSTSWTPPAPASGGPVTPPMTTAPASPSAPASTAPWQPTAATTAPPKEAPADEEESLSLQFGSPTDEQPAQVDAATESEKPESVEDAPETASFAAEAEAAGVRGSEPETERKPDARRSMRAMMFGEESSGGEEPAPTEASTAEPEPASSDSTWRSEPWRRAEDESSASEHVAVEPGIEVPAATTSEADPTAESHVAQAYDAWRPTSPREPEPDPAPVASDEPAETATAELPETPVVENGDRPSAGTIVIIEDDHAAASYYATLFKGNGYQVEVANDGVSGVDLCTRVQPQVILLDVMMPRQNGILVLQTLRASDETKNTPVVVMSNFSEPTLIKRAIQLGALEYVIKTQVEGPALLNALPRWMNREKAFAAA